MRERERERGKTIRDKATKIFGIDVVMILHINTLTRETNRSKKRWTMDGEKFHKV